MLDGAGEDRPLLPQPVEAWHDLSLIYTRDDRPLEGVRASHAAF